MLCLTLRPGDRVQIGDNIEVAMDNMGAGRKATLKIKAPEDIRIRRFPATKVAEDTTY
jgi:sRNA-binding carbon storage regulator CsrA